MALVTAVLWGACTSDGVGDSCAYTRDCNAGLVCDNPTGTKGTCVSLKDYKGPYIDASAYSTPRSDAGADAGLDARVASRDAFVADVPQSVDAPDATDAGSDPDANPPPDGMSSTDATPLSDAATADAGQ